MAKYLFTSHSTIGTHHADTIDDARDEFIQWSFSHLLDLQQQHSGKVVRSEMRQGRWDVIVFKVDGEVIETWKLRKSSWLVDKIREWIG